MFKKLYGFRRFLWGSLWSDLRYRYAGTALGFYWFIINPMFEVLIYTVVFSHLLGFRAPGRDSSYVLFLVTGLFPWLSYTETILRGTNALVQNAAYLRRMSIPTGIFVAKNSLLALFSLIIYLSLLLIYFLFSGHPLGLGLLILPLLAVLMQISAFGVTLVTAHLRVLYPDIGEVLPTVLQLWRWLLPIMYSFDIFPEFLQKILKLNPPYYFIDSFRIVFLDNKLPGVEAWVSMILWTMVLLMIGSFTTAKLHSDVIDEL